MPNFQDTADYFQKQADRTRNSDRKAHYQRCADKYCAQAREVSLKETVQQRLRPLLAETADARRDGRNAGRSAAAS